MLRALSLSSSPRSRWSLAALVAASALAFACGGAEEPPAAPPPPPPPPPPPAAVATTPPPAATTPPAEAPKPAAPTPVFKIADLAAPESVLYDEARDRYLVSNVNGTPFDADNNGFIAEVSPDGKVTTMKWIEGGKNKVTLNAPKGMTIVKDVLYVADINTVRMFDAKSGKPKGEVKLPGATFANDVAASEDGSKIYVTDSGLKPEGQGFGATGTDAVWVIEGGKAKSLAKSTDLEKPNGVVVDGKTLLIAPFGGAEIYRLDDKGKKTDVTKTPKGMLDGIFKVGDDVYVSSWEGSAIYKGKVGGTFEPVFSELKSPADIGFDKKHNRVLVPHMMENTFEAFDLK